MRIIRVAIATLLLVALSGILPPIARASGPTSVLLAAPQYGMVTAVGYDDPEYQQLADLVGAFGDSRPGPATGPIDDNDDFMQQVRLTWLIHDMTVWRIDVIHIDRGEPWVIETREVGPDATDGDSRFHRPADPKALKSLIVGLGLLTAPGGGSDGYPGQAGQVQPADPDQPVSDDQTSTGDAGTTNRHPGAEPDGTEPAGPLGEETAAISGGNGTGWLGLVGAGIGGLAIGVLGYHLASHRQQGRIELIG